MLIIDPLVVIETIEGVNAWTSGGRANFKSISEVEW